MLHTCYNYHQKMMTHHLVITSSLLIKIFKIDKFGDFSCDNDYNSRTDVFRDVISLIINQCDPRGLKGASDGHFVSASRAAQASEALVNKLKLDHCLFVCVYIYIFIYICNELIEETARRRKLIFGVWVYFDYCSSKFYAQSKMSTYHGIMTSLSHF